MYISPSRGGAIHAARFQPLYEYLYKAGMQIMRGERYASLLINTAGLEISFLTPRIALRLALRITEMDTGN